ncbi:unnamed protein product [Lymnaea stagnalis]|uniref:Elongator complex protein 1 n=1 Tax=Lymnaea stagnalis TaxID=6523 RepID=A0AAV2HEG5_LYMST
MRNLQLLDSRLVNDIPKIGDAKLFSLDPEQNIAYVATSSEVIAFNAQDKIIASKSIWDDEPCSPVGLQYLCDQQSLFLSTSDGRLCLWNLNNLEELECVGDVDSGITAEAWSPDLELIVITTGENKLLLISREFDVIVEVPMFPEHEGEESQVAVGWGKKETQFHGSAGKTAAKREEIQVQPVAEHDRGEPRISWRGDGQFFVISAIDPLTRGRFLYIWSRECVFQARSEPVNCLESSLFWKPSGSLIASVQRKEKTGGKEVVFFEKNGLRHGEFAIPVTADQSTVVKSLMWNQDSTILAIWLDNSSDTPHSILQLWTVNNYHWYLKQSLPVDKGIAAALWDAEYPNKMHVVTRAGVYLSLTWGWHVDRTRGRVDEDPCLVAVIDGVQLLVTPVRQMVIPPPMAAFTIALSSPARSVTFGPGTDSCGVAVLLSAGQIAVFRYKATVDEKDIVEKESCKLAAAGGDGFHSQCNMPSLDGIFEIKYSEPVEHTWLVTHLLWLCDDQFIFATSTLTASVLHHGHISREEKALVVSKSLPLQSFVYGMSTCENDQSVAVQLVNGEIFKYIPNENYVQPWLNCTGQAVRFPHPCSQMAVTCIGQEEVVLGLTDRFRFYINDTEVASNCTSFGLQKEFLIFTTFSHTLRCVSKSTKLKEIPKFSDSKSHPFDESVRRIERGSQIVAVVGNGTKVVLQMPRGNLETIHPRALVLSSIKHLLDNDRLLDAFMLMRTHRINLNLLHDHNPTHFVKTVDNFIQQINNPTHLNVFLTDLIEEDVTQTMYTVSYQHRATPSHVTLDSKVDRICDAFLQALQKLAEERYPKFDQTILTAHVRKCQPDLEKALLLVWNLYEKKTTQSSKSAEDALKYLLFLVDVHDMYNAALGLYNFDLVMMVAAKSQKDPKEYIPFLNHLRSLEDNFRYYTIDKHLEKYSHALEHIAKCGDEHFKELVTLVSEHKLHSKALSLFKPATSQFKHLATLYGNYLITKNRHDEAGIMFLKAEEWELALEAFRSARNWRQVFCMAARLDYSCNRISELAVKVAGELKSAQMYKDAATVYEEYAQDIEEAIVALIQGSQWEESLRLMHRYKRLDLIETHLKEAIEESWETIMDVLTSQRSQFDEYRKRLGVVRAEKEKAKNELDDGAEWNEAGADLFSDTTSMTGATVTSLASSNSSRSTIFSKTGSARTRRKAEHKKWSLKEGSANEEFALVDALGKLMVAVFNLKEEISSLVRVLIQFNYDQKAMRLQEFFNEILTSLDTAVSQIWIYNQSSGSNLSLGPNTTASCAAQAIQRGLKLTGGEEPLDPVLLIPPTINKDTRWKLHIASNQDR